MTVAIKLQWNARRTTEDSILSTHRIRHSTCRLYRVVHVESAEFGPPYVAQFWKTDCVHHRWEILSRHRLETAAIKACQQHAEGI